MLRSPPRYTDPSLPPLDEADRKIVSLLMQDGRASGRDLAQHTGISEANVSRRLARLIDERTIRILGYVPPEYLGMHVQAATALRIKGDVDKVANELLRHEEFCTVASTFGTWDLITYTVARNSSELLTLLDRTVLSHPAVAAAETRTVLEFIDPRQRAVETVTQPPPRPIDRTDRMIIREVQGDGRMSFTDIAQRTGVSASSAADRFRRLVTDRIVRIVAAPDPSRIGLHLSGYLALSLERPAREVVKELSSMTELGVFAVMSGPHPIGCEFAVRDGIHFDQLRSRVLGVAGVRGIEVSIIRKYYRSSMVWGEPEGAA
ncbi:MAG: AsnC family transcriptional regulator [Phycisphaerales bacterium]